MSQQSLPLTGVTYDDQGAAHILVGQLITATVVSGILKVNPPPSPGGWNYQWTIPTTGNPFTSYSPSAQPTSCVPFTAQNAGSNSWFFGYHGSFTISCYVTYPGGSFTVSSNVTVDGPTFTSAALSLGYYPVFYQTRPPIEPGDPAYVGIPPGTAYNGMALYGAQLTGYSGMYGMMWAASTATPPAAPYGTDGHWIFTQTVNPWCVYYDSMFNDYTCYWETDSNGNPIWPICLDGRYPSWPIPAWPEFPATSDVKPAADSPSSPFLDWAWEDYYSTQFQTYVFYTPPHAASPPPKPWPSGVNDSVMPVPVEEMDWKFKADAWYNQDPPANTWYFKSASQGGPGVLKSYPWPFPAWNYCIPIDVAPFLDPPYTGS